MKYSSVAHASRRALAAERLRNRTARPDRRMWSGVVVSRNWLEARLHAILEVA